MGCECYTRERIGSQGSLDPSVNALFATTQHSDPTTFEDGQRVEPFVEDALNLSVASPQDNFCKPLTVGVQELIEPSKSFVELFLWTIRDKGVRDGNLTNELTI